MNITIKTSQKQEMVDITSKVNDILQEKGIKEGICNVHCMHTTAALCITENWDKNIPSDLFKGWNKAIPPNDGYKHDAVDGDAQSHIIAATVGPNETIPVKNGKLHLGQWQALMLVELSGGRERTIEVSIANLL